MLKTCYVSYENMTSPAISIDIDECVICLEVLDMNSTVQLMCGHKLHTTCLKRIIHVHDTISTCPLCRKFIAYSFTQQGSTQITKTVCKYLIFWIYFVLLWTFVIYLIFDHFLED